jgi:hypothetical protein
MWISGNEFAAIASDTVRVREDAHRLPSPNYAVRVRRRRDAAAPRPDRKKVPRIHMLSPGIEAIWKMTGPSFVSAL